MSEPGQGDYSGKSDVELFRLIQMAGRSSPASRDAFTEIYNRYAKGLQSHALKTYPGTLKRVGDVNDFVQQVFMDFWETKIFAFDCSRADSSATMAKLVKCWLAKIGFWVIKKWRRSNSADKLPVPVSTVGVDANEIRALEVTDTGQANKELHERVEDALRFLTIRERDVVATCTKHFDSMTSECRVDDASVKARLMRDHNFQTWAAVRKCLERALKKLKQSLLNRAEVA
jgi:DNA-directed RNA polymerase specialized sigma24 family protein